MTFLINVSGSVIYAILIIIYKVKYDTRVLPLFGEAVDLQIIIAAVATGFCGIC